MLVSGSCFTAAEELSLVHGAGNSLDVDDPMMPRNGGEDDLSSALR